MSTLLPYQPSLASATQTRVDSACKHIQQCRVSTDDLLPFTVPAYDDDQLQREKYRFCVHKDECVVGIGRPWSNAKTRKRMNNAYPRVTSNLGGVGEKVQELEAPMKMIRYMAHYARSTKERNAIIKWFESGEYHDPQWLSEEAFDDKYIAFDQEAVSSGAPKLKLDTKKWMGVLTDFISIGYANTLGWAHPNTGDTMTSVMIGGLRTVMNGDFEIFTGDILQWYWPFELDCFEPDGRRKDYLGKWVVQRNKLLPPNLDPATGANNVNHSQDIRGRQAYHERQFGQQPGKIKMVARIKPYFRDDDNPRMYDFSRVFAVAISCARPFEMVDIKIGRQSL